MARNDRKQVATGPGNPWRSTIEKLDGVEEPTQAGEFVPGLEEGLGGGDKGFDAETGPGGYGGDAAEAGHDAALAEPDRPLDSEIHGDPRTHAGEPYPDEDMSAELDQGQSEAVEPDSEIVEPDTESDEPSEK